MNKKRLITVCLLIIGIDLLTKILALNVLPFNNHVNVFGDNLTLYLAYNMGSSGGQADYILAQENNKNIALLMSSMIGIILMVYIVIIYNKPLRKLYKWLIGVGLLILFSVLSESFKQHLNQYEISNWLTSVVGKIAGLTIYLTFFILTKNNSIRLFLSVIISAGLGNLISHFYFPYRIIDFINIKGSYELIRIGVFNIAVFAFYCGVIGLIIVLIIRIINKIKLRHTIE